MTDIDICLCTFRRPLVESALRSLAQLRLPEGVHIHIIVADNDETPSARKLVETTAQELSLPVTYIHAPARNISVARNACLNAATSPLIAFLDDDEEATPRWLSSLLKKLNESGADVVLGPVRAIYPATTPSWMIEGDFHATRPVWVKGQILTGYTCNVLFRRDTDTIKGLRFRNELGRSGGEDTAFFGTVHSAGGRIAYAPEAWLTEHVPLERLSLGWLARRRFRSGQTHGALLLEKHGTSTITRLRQCAKAAAKLAYCALMCACCLLSAPRWRFWWLRGAVHAGVISRLLGKKELVQYG